MVLLDVEGTERGGWGRRGEGECGTDAGGHLAQRTRDNPVDNQYQYLHVIGDGKKESR